MALGILVAVLAVCALLVAFVLVPTWLVDREQLEAIAQREQGEDGNDPSRG